MSALYRRAGFKCKMKPDIERTRPRRIWSSNQQAGLGCPLDQRLSGLSNGWCFVELSSRVSRREAQARQDRTKRPDDRNNETGAAIAATASRNNVIGAVIDLPALVDRITCSAAQTLSTGCGVAHERPSSQWQPLGRYPPRTL